MAWQIKVTEKASKQIKKLGISKSKRISDYLRHRIGSLDNPRQLGKSLQGSKYGNYWRYRVGSYRLLCELHDDELIVLIIEVGHRREVYR